MSKNPNCALDCMYYSFCDSNSGVSEGASVLTQQFGSKCQAEQPGNPAQCAIVGGAMVVKAVTEFPNGALK